jgi:hypothetical protein
MWVNGGFKRGCKFKLSIIERPTFSKILGTTLDDEASGRNAWS